MNSGTAHFENDYSAVALMIRSPKSAHDFFAGCTAAASRMGRDFIGTISTSASVKSLWTTFTFSKESSTCTGVRFLSNNAGAGLKIEIGFNLLIQVVARAVAPWRATAGIFCVLTHGVAFFLAGIMESRADDFGNSA